MGMANSVMAWVVGLISPILLACYSVNQRLPSGPAVIRLGPALEVGVGNSVIESKQRSSSPSSRNVPACGASVGGGRGAAVPRTGRAPNRQDVCEWKPE